MLLKFQFQFVFRFIVPNYYLVDIVYPYLSIHVFYLSREHYIVLSKTRNHSEQIYL